MCVRAWVRACVRACVCVCVVAPDRWRILSGIVDNGLCTCPNHRGVRSPAGARRRFLTLTLLEDFDIVFLRQGPVDAGHTKETRVVVVRKRWNVRSRPHQSVDIPVVYIGNASCRRGLSCVWRQTPTVRVSDRDYVFSVSSTFSQV